MKKFLLRLKLLVKVLTKKYVICITSNEGLDFEAYNLCKNIQQARWLTMKTLENFYSKADDVTIDAFKKGLVNLIIYGKEGYSLTTDGKIECLTQTQIDEALNSVSDANN